jgi:hypothetical protein
MQRVDHHDQVRSRFTIASRHGVNKNYITHQFVHRYMGITNAAAYYFEANPHLQKREGAHRSFGEDTAEHLMYAKSIDLEGMYGHSALDLFKDVTWDKTEK